MVNTILLEDLVSKFTAKDTIEIKKFEAHWDYFYILKVETFDDNYGITFRLQYSSYINNDPYTIIVEHSISYSKKEYPALEYILTILGDEIYNDNIEETYIMYLVHSKTSELETFIISKLPKAQV